MGDEIRCRGVDDGYLMFAEGEMYTFACSMARGGKRRPYIQGGEAVEFLHCTPASLKLQAQL